jgi:hypothetical protein
MFMFLPEPAQRDHACGCAHALCDADAHLAPKKKGEAIASPFKSG